MTSCPIVRDETVRLFERIEVGGKTQFVPFEQRVLWLRRSETTLRLVHKGNVVKDCAGLNDFYGFLTSIESVPGDDGPRLINAYGLDGESPLTLEADVVITDSPVLCLRDGEDRYYDEYKGKVGWKQPYAEVPSYHNGGKWWYTSDQPKDPADPHSGRPALEPITFEVRSKAWIHTDGIGKMPSKLADWVSAKRSEAKPIAVYPAK